jgi:LL-diaminopimelate aminotransferase
MWKSRIRIQIEKGKHMKLNENYLKLEKSYLFTRINKEVREYTAKNPEVEIIKMGIGDVTKPLVPTIVKALEKASAEMGVAETFRGYGDEQGYAFLREQIASYYADKGVAVDANEVFVSDGAKSDVGNVVELFATDAIVGIPNPVYPVYVDTNIMQDREIKFMNGTKENDFLPLPGEDHVDIIYLCSPNNPTGNVYTKEQLKKWVDYAIKEEAIILFDAAYEAFVSNDSLPSSIFEIEGAKKCAIEFCSFSKTAGFTGTRCGYTVISKELVFDDIAVYDLWLRRQTTKFNGVSYIVQRGAEAAYSEEGKKEIFANIAAYKENAKIIMDTMDKLGINYWGGEHSPYIWLECPNGMKSWEYFTYLLETCGIVGTPGAGFGSEGEGYFRLTAFNTKENTIKAMKRMEDRK